MSLTDKLTAYRILSYASTPLLPSPQAYVEFVGEMKELGFRAIKFHFTCVYESDTEIVRAVHAKFGDSGLRLMLDVEQRYTRAEALKAARELQEPGYAWFAAPLPDFDLEGYRALKRPSTYRSSRTRRCWARRARVRSANSWA